MPHLSRSTTGLVVVSSAALLLAACGSTQNAAAPSGASSAAAGSSMEPLRAKLAAASAIPKFSSSSEPIDVAPLRGKSIFAVPLATTPENKAIGDAMKTVAERVGMKYTSCENQGKNAQLSQCLDQARATNQSVVVLHADPSALGPQLQALQQAKIPVLSLHYFAEGTKVEDAACKGCSAGVTAIQPAPLALPAELMTDWVITHGKDVNALVPMITGLAPTVVMQAAVEAEFKKHCPACKYKILPISVADVTGSGYQTSVSSALNADPKVNYVISQTDFLLPATFAALKTTGRSNVKVVSRNGNPDALSMIAQKTGLEMDVGESAQWVGYAAMDNSFRLILGKPTNPEATPVRAWTAENVHEAGNPPAGNTGYGDAFERGYLKLWGLQ